MPRPSKGNRSNPWGSAVADFKNLRSNRSGLAMDVTGKGVKNSKSNTAAGRPVIYLLVAEEHREITSGTF